MVIIRIIVAALLASALMTGPAIAGEKGHMMGHEMMDYDWKGHHTMMQEMMGMTKEMMGMLKDMNHSPSDSQKKRLGEMMNKMDEMMKQHDEMMKEMGGKKGRM